MYKNIPIDGFNMYFNIWNQVRKDMVIYNIGDKVEFEGKLYEVTNIIQDEYVLEEVK